MNWTFQDGDYAVPKPAQIENGSSCGFQVIIWIRISIRFGKSDFRSDRFQTRVPNLVLKSLPRKIDHSPLIFNGATKYSSQKLSFFLPYQEQNLIRSQLRTVESTHGTLVQSIVSFCGFVMSKFYSFDRKSSLPQHAIFYPQPLGGRILSHGDSPCLGWIGLYLGGMLTSFHVNSDEILYQ